MLVGTGGAAVTSPGWPGLSGRHETAGVCLGHGKDPPPDRLLWPQSSLGNTPAVGGAVEGATAPGTPQSDSSSTLFACTSHSSR